MALEMFMRLEGVTGGSRNYHHKGWADVLSWRWAMARADEGGAATMNELHLTKSIGIDSPAMLGLFAAGTPIAKAELSVVPVVGKRDQQQKYVAIQLHDVTIQSIKINGVEEENFFKEDITLRFARVNYEYFEYGASGTDGKPPPAQAFAFGWDLASNAAC